MNQLDRVITSRVSATLPSLVKIVPAVSPPRVCEMYGSRAFYHILFFIFLYSLTRIGLQPTAYSLQPIPVILTHNSSKDANWLKEVPFKQVFFRYCHFPGVIFPKTHQYFTASMEIPCKEKMSNNFRITFELGQKLPITTNRKSWSLFQNPSWKIAWNAP